jgi:hypothetical protein
MQVRPEVLIATLGTEAQVVTLSLLELERLGFGVSEVVVVHTAAKRDKIRESIERLDEAFADDPRLSCYHYRRELLQADRVSGAPQRGRRAQADVHLRHGHGADPVRRRRPPMAPGIG